jgi:EmrB/QacA subfamily drug resistance transporter
MVEGSSHRGNGMGGGASRGVLLTVFLGTFMAPLDSSIVNVALPAIAADFSAGIVEVGWVVTAYLLMTSSLLLAAGRLGDTLGHKRVYIGGFVVFTVASVLCALAGSLGHLVAARALQAVGGSAMLATGPAILTDAFPPARRGRALGTIAVAVAIGLTAGPFFGGLLTAGPGWRWIFLVNLPIGLLVVTMATLLLRESTGGERRPFDLAGASALFVALFALLFGLSMGGRWGWGGGGTLGLLALALLAMTGFVAIERRSSHPLLDPALFSLRLFTSASLSAGANYVALFVAVFLTPFSLVAVYGETIRTAGLIMTVIPLLMGLSAPAAGVLSDRIGSRLLSSAGLGIVALSLAGLSASHPEEGRGPVILFLALMGLGSGVFQTPNTSALMGSVPPARRGVAAGMQATCRNLGMVLGVALAGAIVGTIAPGGSGDPALGSAIRTAYLAGAFAALVGMAVSLSRGGVGGESVDKRRGEG